MFNSILPPRIHLKPVLDISAVLVQYPVPFVALGRAAFYIITRASTTTSHGRRTQRIVHAACGVVFAENQTCGIQGIPAYIIRYGMVCNEQAVGIFILLCILLSGCRLRCELVGVHRACIGKRHIMQGAVRQIAVYRSGNIHCRKVKIISAAGGEGELLVDPFLHRQRNVCESAGEVGHFIAVVLLVEDLERICSLSKRRDRELCRAIFVRERGRAAAIIRRVACRVQNHGGNVFVCAGLSAGIANLYRSASGVRRKICGGHSEAAAAAVLQRQLPLVSGIFVNFGQPAGRLAAHSGGCKEDRAQIQVKSGAHTIRRGGSLHKGGGFTISSHEGGTYIMVTGGA